MNNFREKVNFIFSIADALRGPYKPNQYGKVILPLTVLRRLDPNHIAKNIEADIAGLEKDIVQMLREVVGGAKPLEANDE